MKKTNSPSKIEVFKTKLRKIGNSYGIIIPSRILHEASLTEGDDIKLSVIDGNIIIEKLDTQHDRFMKLHEYSMMRFSKAYEELAK